MTDDPNPLKQSHLIARSIEVLNAAGYQCSRLDGAFGQFDLIALSSTDVLLVRVCQDKIPFAAYLDDLKAITAPPNSRKGLHVWKADDLPDFVEL